MSTGSHKPEPDGGVPLGAASGDEPPNTLPGEPAHITRLSGQAVPGGDAGGSAVREHGQMSRQAKTKTPGGGRTKSTHNEEPEPAQEEDVPSDGHDQVGEEMIERLAEHAPEPGARDHPTAGA